jgi:hypothetical protein
MSFVLSNRFVPARRLLGFMEAMPQSSRLILNLKFHERVVRKLKLLVGLVRLVGMILQVVLLDELK